MVSSKAWQLIIVAATGTALAAAPLLIYRWKRSMCVLELGVVFECFAKSGMGWDGMEWAMVLTCGVRQSKCQASGGAPTAA